ncbi:hypothetical protein AVEN_102868-1 [Araneus ventricosus]|uniref:Retrotransposon gag domain-containing protein n=1 Tax=Araneus ventricosus TaxID=182803 RepID=A0A4Y2V124_ARAVE|nr:hypothetical protein AVEN_102868-1 [Araneus ventricosus]
MVRETFIGVHGDLKPEIIVIPLIKKGNNSTWYSFLLSKTWGTSSSGVTGITTPRYPSVGSPFKFPLPSVFCFQLLIFPFLEGRRGSSPREAVATLFVTCFSRTANYSHVLAVRGDPLEGWCISVPSVSIGRYPSHLVGLLKGIKRKGHSLGLAFRVVTDPGGDPERFQLAPSLVEAPGTINTTEKLRRSRRVQGHPPEFGLLLDPIRGPRKMPESKETTPKLLDDTSSVPVRVLPAPVPILTYQLPRTPCIFSGDDNQQDVNNWLRDFQRTATYNHWDDQMCLANVIFYFAGTARQWFDNNEDTFTNFTTFKNSLSNAFCRTEDLRRQAERLLLTRTQQIGEMSESYIQDVLSLCRKANPSMSEDEKVAHLMKGIAEDLYQTLLVQDFRRVDEFVKRCREIESLRRRRITRTRFQRLPNVSAVLAETDVGDIRPLYVKL